MSTINDNFLQAEESAQKLLAALSSLRNEAVSYKTSTKELEVVRRDLLNFVDSSRTIAKDTHDVVVLLKNIGGPEILSSINSFQSKLREESGNNNRKYRQLKIVTYICLAFSLLTFLGIVTLLLK